MTNKNVLVVGGSGSGKTRFFVLGNLLQCHVLPMIFCIFLCWQAVFFRVFIPVSQKPVYDATYQALLFLCKLLLIGDILITAWAVAGRYLPFVADPHWSEEMVLTLMVYMAMLSATLAIRKRAHIRMTAFDRYLSRRAIMVSDLLADIAVFILGAVLLVYGIKLCASPLARLGRYASLPQLSKFWQYLSVPVSGAGMVIFEMEQIFQRMEAFYEKDGKEAA